MKHTEANLGRIFILRMEHGDRIPDVMEEFAKANQIKSALVLFEGGADKGIMELVNHSAQRKIDPHTGFELLEV